MCPSIGWGAEYHVAISGSDTAAGTSAKPFKTIGKAAQVAVAGDTVTIHEGTYREMVQPINGGTSEATRITYRSAPGEQAVIKGSERITTWVDQGGGIWKVELPVSFFGSFNPYTLSVQVGGFMTFGQWHSRGDVYLDNEAFYEKQTLQELTGTSNTWFTSISGTTTSIFANFGTSNPNTSLADRVRAARPRRAPEPDDERRGTPKPRSRATRARRLAAERGA